MFVFNGTCASKHLSIVSICIMPVDKLFNNKVGMRNFPKDSSFCDENLIGTLEGVLFLHLKKSSMCDEVN